MWHVFYNYSSWVKRFSSKLYSRRVIRGTRFREEVNIGEDWIFCVEAIAKAKAIVFLHSCPYAMCRDKNPVSLT